MATPYSEVYSRILGKISDYSFLNMTQEEVEESLEPYLLSSCVKFKKCLKNLGDRDKVNKQFNEDLTEEETEILASLMIVEYLSPKIITSDLLQQSLSSKDYKIYSQANHIKEIKDLRKTFKEEANTLLMSYSYSSISLDKLK
jgi:hypothetical protein